MLLDDIKKRCLAEGSVDLMTTESLGGPYTIRARMDQDDLVLDCQESTLIDPVVCTSNPYEMARDIMDNLVGLDKFIFVTYKGDYFGRKVYINPCKQYQWGTVDWFSDRTISSMTIEEPGQYLCKINSYNSNDRGYTIYVIPVKKVSQEIMISIFLREKIRCKNAPFSSILHPKYMEESDESARAFIRKNGLNADWIEYQDSFNWGEYYEKILASENTDQEDEKLSDLLRSKKSIDVFRDGIRKIAEYLGKTDKQVECQFNRYQDPILFWDDCENAYIHLRDIGEIRGRTKNPSKNMKTVITAVCDYYGKEKITIG